MEKHMKDKNDVINNLIHYFSFLWSCLVLLVHIWGKKGPFQLKDSGLYSSFVEVANEKYLRFPKRDWTFP